MLLEKGVGKILRSNNVQPSMGVEEQEILHAFGLQVAEWVVDPYERCLVEHRDRAREILGITEGWPASTIKL